MLRTTCRCLLTIYRPFLPASRVIRRVPSKQTFMIKTEGNRCEEINSKIVNSIRCHQITK